MSSFARTHPWVELPADVWHADALASAPLRVVATGDAALNAQLPGGGWPVGALTEILQPAGVHSEWRLLLPALAQCGHGPVMLVGPPQVPFVPALQAQGLQAQRLLWMNAPAMATRLWATEQALRCAAVDAVLAWLPQVRADPLRRLQMAAAQHGKLLFVMRAAQAQSEASPAVLRLLVAPQEQDVTTDIPNDALEVQVLKRRGPPLAQPLHLKSRSAQLTLLLAASHAHALDCTASPA